jgi:glycosyltransferase involved in cell wall biosynthesis
MVKKKRIGIIYNFDENWIGGAYYIENIIKSLNYLQEKEQMQLHILTKDKSTFQELLNTTGYHKLKYVQYKPQYNKFERFFNRLTNRIFKRKWIIKKINLDCIFPLYGIPQELLHIKKLIFWIPDFQEKFLPDFFSPREIMDRQRIYDRIVALNNQIVFSSHSALNDFNTFYPNAKNPRCVLQFAVIHPNLESNEIDKIKVKYGINGDYYFSPNQFWQHKNQIAVIEAVKLLKVKEIEVKVVFTGKEYDYRNVNYVRDLKQLVIQYELEKQIMFLGFIDRIDQLMLMKNAIAVIQPSLFEGWSTVIEDAKALNQTLIVSNIAVHQEQLGNKAYYFSPNNYQELTNKMIEVLENPIDKLCYDSDYSKNIKNFALNFNLLLNKNLPKIK